MTYRDYSSLKIRADAGVAFVTFDHPPMNLLDTRLVAELDRFCSEVHSDPDVRVIVFDSANPDYFIAHYDIEDLLARTGGAPAKSGTLKPFHLLLERYRTLPKATIARIEGRTRGGGMELALSLDMRFGAIGRAVLGQPEVALGLLPGGTGSQRLPRQLGRGRALEVILGADDFDAETAARYGWLNRALPAADLGPFVDQIARRIASHSLDAISLAKQATDAADLPLHDGLREEAYLFSRLLAHPDSARRMRAFLAAGGQTAAGELDIGATLDRALRGS
jgi:enoyl-CoA hydratase/carnithine racemase